MARKKKDEMNTPAEQAEILDKPVRLDGVGEDPAIQAMASEAFTKMNDEEAMGVALAVAKIFRGQIQAEIDGSLAQMKQLVNQMEQTAKQYEEDRVKFAEDIFNRAEQMRKNGNGAVSSVKGAELMQQAMAEARAIGAQRRFELEQKVINAPKIKFVHPGEQRTVMRGGNKVTEVRPFVIAHEHLTFVCPPNKPVEIPDFVYEAYLKERELAEQRDKLQAVLKVGTADYGKAIEVAPEVDPNYAAHISQNINRSGIAIPQGGTNEHE